jgi:hypothetical protein
MVTLKPLRPACRAGQEILVGAQPLARGDRVGLDGFGGNLPGGVRRLVAHQVDLAAEQIVHRRRRALVRHGLHVDLERALEQQAAQMRGGAKAGIGEVDLALVRLQPLRQLGVVVRRHDREVVGLTELVDHAEVFEVPSVSRHHDRAPARCHANVCSSSV